MKQNTIGVLLVILAFTSACASAPSAIETATLPAIQASSTAPPSVTFTPPPSPTATQRPSATPIPTSTPIGAGTSSYELGKVGFNVPRMWFNKSLWLGAIAYADFNKDGLMDIFAAPVTGREQGAPVNLFLQIEPAVWRDFTSEFIVGDVPQPVHPRKAIVADFNGDGNPDVYIADHGYDKPPYPGSTNVLLLSDENGHLIASRIHQELKGFHHGASAADVDNDGDVDIFVCDTTRNPKYFLINDGTGRFTQNTSLVPSEIRWETVYSAELIDIDADGFVDLVTGGHEYEGPSTRIYWGDGTGQFTDQHRILLPKLMKFGVVLDFDSEDIDADGKKDLVITRTGSPPTFYSGYYIQVLIQVEHREFSDESMERIIVDPMTWDGRTGEWIDWIRLVDINDDGMVDILVDDASRKLEWFNEGNGYFSEE
jgi:hypothetical protein